MSIEYGTLLAELAARYDVSTEHLEQRVRSRRARVHGLVGRNLMARSVALSLAIGAAEQRLTAFLAAGARHVSGQQIGDAIRATQAEEAQGHRVSLGYWAQPQDTPQMICNQYLAAIEALGALGPTPQRRSVSIKVDQLGFEPERVLQVLHSAMAHGVRVHFDAQAHDTTDRTHALLELGLKLGADVSGTLPSRWLRSFDDAERFIDWRIPIRVVKGQGCDPLQPKIDPRRSLIELVDRLAGRAAEIGIATHDQRAAEPALRRLLAAGTPCALEQLRSLPRLDFVADALCAPVRAYVAYGRFGLPYTVGEFMRRPAILGWILRDLAVRRRPSHRDATGSAPPA